MTTGTVITQPTPQPLVLAAVLPGDACLDCGAEPGQLCHWWCPKYREESSDG